MDLKLKNRRRVEKEMRVVLNPGMGGGVSTMFSSSRERHIDPDERCVWERD
jgi:hypothetical protein